MKVDLAGKLDELSALAEYSLKEKDFYVVRDADYLAWKYLENPTIGNYHATRQGVGGSNHLFITLQKAGILHSLDGSDHPRLFCPSTFWLGQRANVARGNALSSRKGHCC